MPFSTTQSPSFWATNQRLPRGLSNVSLKVFGVNGREVATLIDGVHPGGLREITWNAEGMPSGVYLAKLEIGGVADTERLVLLK